MMNISKAAALVLLSLAALGMAYAEVSSSTDLNFQASTRPEAKLMFTQSFSFPVLQGESPLTEGNNIKTSLSADITPVSLNGAVDLSWTPVAFLQLSAGAKAGSGWHIKLFGGDVYGLGIRRRSGQHDAEVIGDPFGGLLWSARAGGTFQFDLAALFPGDWKHVVFLTYHEINYKGFSAASSSDSWYFENDDGENRNGFNYYANFVLGYQMPIFFNMVAFMAELDKYLYDTPDRELWGDELGRWIFSGLFNFKITEWFSAAAILQFRTRRNFTEETRDYEFYQDRRLVSSGAKRHLEFYRVALNLSFKLR